MSDSGQDRLRRLADASEADARNRALALDIVETSRRPARGLGKLLAAWALLALVVTLQAWHGHRQSVRLQAAIEETSQLAQALAKAQAAEGAAARDQGTLATLQPALVAPAASGAPPGFRFGTPP